jgi:predicted transcriptional regulator
MATPQKEPVVDTLQQNPYSRTMVRFTPDQEAQLSQIASHAGTDTEHLVRNAALRLVEENARFRAAVREGLIQADQEQLIDDDEVRQWIEQQEDS